MKLGSLFDGSGGFPLAGMINGIKPVWASEVEPYPVRLTAKRFPEMKQLGDIMNIDGKEIEPVDIITFGSPCQDLSVAGKRAGIQQGARSVLFFEAIRIIKEMREATNGEYPKYAVWENVPGAFSSNQRADFGAVLQAFAEIKQDNISIPVPKKWEHAGTVVGDGWSVAWREYDAQYWGVPQRRKRIYLIADFRTERAGEILFKSESVSGNTEQSEETGQGVAGDTEKSTGKTGIIGRAVDVYNQTINDDIASTVTAAVGGSNTSGAKILQPSVVNVDIIRRLTPLECCRLQGFPDWWMNDVEGSDTAKYKMWGNGIALPCAVDVLKRISNTERR